MCQIVKIMTNKRRKVYFKNMKKDIKKFLIFGATAHMAESFIQRTLSEGDTVYAVSRSNLNIEHGNLHKYNLDLVSEDDINAFFNKLCEIKFDAIINFQGVAISSPVENLDRDELKKQLDISLYSILYILKNAKKHLNNKGLFINLSSMAAFGLFPFISPYSIAKASSDILLNAFEIETGIKTVSIKPGVVGTKFWKFCIDENLKNFDKFNNEYKIIGNFIKNNAFDNTNRGLKPEAVAKLLYKIVNSKHPKSSYTIGLDAHFMKFLSYFKGRLLFKFIRSILNFRINRYKNEQQ